LLAKSFILFLARDHPVASTDSFVEPIGMGIAPYGANALAELNRLPTQPPFFTANHILPLTAAASGLSTKSGST